MSSFKDCSRITMFQPWSRVSPKFAKVCSHSGSELPKSLQETNHPSIHASNANPFFLHADITATEKIAQLTVIELKAGNHCSFLMPIKSAAVDILLWSRLQLLLPCCCGNSKPCHWMFLSNGYAFLKRTSKWSLVFVLGTGGWGWSKRKPTSRDIEEAGCM